MDALIGIWRLVESKAWDEAGNSLPAPYGARPLGQITNNPLQTAYISSNGAVIDGITCSGVG